MWLVVCGIQLAPDRLQSGALKVYQRSGVKASSHFYHLFTPCSPFVDALAASYALEPDSGPGIRHDVWCRTQQAACRASRTSERYSPPHELFTPPHREAPLVPQMSIEIT